MLFHGSKRPFQVGQILNALFRPTEFSNCVSIDGINVEEFVESFRPMGAVSRFKCIFMVDDVDDLNIAGAAEDFVYEVESMSIVTKVHFGWFSELLGIVFDKEPLQGNEKANNLAKGYWSGRDFKRTADSGPAAREYLCESVRIVKLVKKARRNTMSRPTITDEQLRRIVAEELKALKEGVDHEGVKKVVTGASKLLQAVEALKDNSTGAMMNALMPHLDKVQEVLEAMVNSPASYVDKVAPVQKVVKLRRAE